MDVQSVTFRRARTAVRTIARALASRPWALALWALLAGVLAWATLLEAARGRELAQWHVYTRPWFVALLGLLGVHVLAATLIRFPWKQGQAGFAIAHAGVLLLLVGAIQTLLFGVEGEILLREGEGSDSLRLAGRSQITVVRSTEEGRLSSRFTFNPGAVDWPPDQTRDCGQAHGLGLEVKRFYRHARPEVRWVADEHDYEGPALHLRLLTGNGEAVGEDWLAASISGGEAIIGPTMHVLLPVPMETMVEDFLDPPLENLGEAGIVSVHHGGKLYRIHVDGSVRKRHALADTGIEVEIVDYLPDARPARGGTFISRSSQPKNPVLALKIYLPDEQVPIRQLVFAKRPLLNLDAAYGRQCPVRFWYHHPAVAFAPGAHFMQTPAGKLYCRAVISGACREPREVKEGSTIALGGPFAVLVTRHIPRARQQIDFLPLESAGPSPPAPEAAAQVEVTCKGHRRRVWLRRGDERYGYQSLLTPQGVVTLSFGYEEAPLGFRVELEDFVRRPNPGRQGDAALASAIRLVDPSNKVNEIRKVSMNQPLQYGKYTLYQSSFQPRSEGDEVSVITAAYDPGRLLKYVGSLMLGASMFTLFYIPAFRFRAAVMLRRRWLDSGAPPDSMVDCATPVASPSIPQPHLRPRRTIGTDGGAS